MKRINSKAIFVLSLSLFSTYLTGCGSNQTSNITPIISQQEVSASSESTKVVIIKKALVRCGSVKATLTYDSKKDSDFFNSDFSKFLVAYNDDVECSEMELKGVTGDVKKYKFTIDGFNQAKLNLIMSEYSKHIKLVS